MKRYYVFATLFLCLLGCQNKKKAELSETIKKIIEPNLKSWIAKAPFDGKFNIENNKDNQITIDNRAQVFPFMGKFKNENDNFINSDASNGAIYEEEVSLFKDSTFGESFVYASLLYKPEELFITDYYSERGNVIFSWNNAINETYYATLSETKVVTKNNQYKTAIYWVDSNYKKYLFGFFQKENLVFQFGFPCNTDEKQKGVDKIKKINKSLNLNIKEWETVTQEKLEVNPTPLSFWKNPYYGIYHEKMFTPKVQVKILNTNFKEIKNKSEADYVFAYQKDEKPYTISFKKEKTSLNKEQYESQFDNETKHIITNNLRKKKIFITIEKTTNNQVTTEAETYFKDNFILKIKSTYPEKDIEAEKQLLDILTNLKISEF